MSESASQSASTSELPALILPVTDLDVASKLCDAIIQWQAQNTVRSVGINRRIHWDAVADILFRVYSIEKTSHECHRLWKFYAYGHHYESTADLEDSDNEEGFLQPIEAFDRALDPKDAYVEPGRYNKLCFLKKKKFSTSATIDNRVADNVKVFVPNRIGKDPHSLKSIHYCVSYDDKYVL
jgi:hypothetical protein